jgi:YopX protein
MKNSYNKTKTRFKFRVWNPRTKILEYSYTKARISNYLLDLDGNLKFHSDCDAGMLGDIYDDVVTQFTGFVDRNGKDIYEGDIFYSDSQYTWDAVEFIKGRFVANLQGARLFDLYELFDGYQKHRPEVVGNIFENPNYKNEQLK